MAVIYRRPGVYLEESPFNNPPANIGSSQAAAVFTGAASKGPVDTPIRVESWSDYTTIFGGFTKIEDVGGGPSARNDVYLAATPTALLGIPNPRQGDIALVNEYRYTPTTFYKRDAADAAASGYDAPHVVYVYSDVDTGWVNTSFELNTNNETFGTSGLSYMDDFPGQTHTVSGVAFHMSSSADATHALPGVAKFGDIGLHYNTTTTGWQLHIFGDANYTFSDDTNGTHDNTGGLPETPLGTGWTAIDKAYQDTVFGSGGMDVDAEPLTWSIWTHPDSTDTTFFREDILNLMDLPGPSGAVGGINWVGWSPDLVGSPGGTATALTYLPYAVNSFFQNGGRTSWIIRSASTTSPGLVASATSYTDGVSSTAFTLEAIGTGTWGNAVAVNVEETTIVSGNPIFTVRVLVDGAEVERFANLAMVSNQAGVKRVDLAINDPGTGSRYVTLTDFDESVIPVLDTGGVVRDLSGGTDPDLPSSLDLVASATNNVTKIEGSILVNIVGHTTDPSDPSSFVYPTGLSSSQIVGNSGRTDVFVVNDGCPQRPAGKSSRDYINQEIQSTLIGAGANDAFMAVYTPWIVVPDPSTPGGTIPTPPGGAVLGVMARTDAVNGVFRTPAGIIANITNALGVDTKFTDTELGDLNQNHVNVTRPVQGGGIAIMGGRTRKKYGVDMYIAPRRTLIFIEETLKASTQFAVFENNDERLWSRLKIIADQVLRPLWNAGGLRGESTQEAYFIQCDASINTPTVIASGEVRMEVGVALEYPAEFVVIRVSQFDGTTSISEIQPSA